MDNFFAAVKEYNLSKIAIFCDKENVNKDKFSIQHKNAEMKYLSITLQQINMILNPIDCI
jgi:hypothetical protein